MTTLTREQIEKTLNEIKDPETGKGLKQQGQIKSLEIADSKISLQVGLTSYSAPLKDDVVDSIQSKLGAIAQSGTKIQVEIVPHSRPIPSLGQVGLHARNVIAVGSGKGGVGKSTVAACIAMGLLRAGCRVGLLDADVYGPSVPQLTGASGQPAQNDKRIEPIVVDGLKVMSIGFLVPADQAVIWRGPMLHSAVTQFLSLTNWGELDYLIIDMPPGTGDIALTLSQLLPLTGSVVVCTPQDVALIDAVKAVAMFRKVKIPILGLVENMSGFICPDNGKRYDIFGKGGAKDYAEQDQIPFLGELPINIGIRESGDAGTTKTLFDDPQVAPYLQRVVYQLARHIANQTALAPVQPSLPVL